MILKDLLEFKPKSKKQLINYLSKNNIIWKNKKRDIVVDKISTDEYKDIKLIYKVVYRDVICLQIYFDKKSCSLEQIKTTLINVFGVPERDNTKHNLDYVVVHWNYESRYISLIDKIADDEILLSYNFLQNDFRRNENKYLLYVSIPFVIIFGILFFIFFGLEFGYSWLLFVLSMIDGLIGGFLCVICIEKINHHRGRIKKLNISEKDKIIFTKYEKDNKISSNGFYCIVSKTEKNKIVNFKSKIYVLNDEFNFLYLDNKKIVTETKKFKNIKRYHSSLNYRSVLIQFHDSPSLYMFNLENIETIVEKLDDILGYNTPKFLNIKTTVFNSLVSFDPENIIAGGASKEIFLDDAKEIAIQLYGKNNIDVGLIKYILESTTFDGMELSGMDGINFDSLTLAINIFDDLQKNGLIS